MRTRLRHNLKVASITAAILFAVGGGFTTVGFANHYDPTSYDSSSDAKIAYKTAVYQAAQNEHRFPSATQVAAQIARTHPSFDIRVGSERAAVSALRQRSGGAHGTLYVVPRQDNKVEIVARHRSSAIDALVGDSHGDQHERAFSVDHFKWHPLDVVLAAEGGGLVALALLFSFLFAASGVSEETSGEERWSELVPADYAYGPVEPEEGFSLRVPVCLDHLGEPWFTTTVATYSGGGWRGADREETRQITNPDGTTVDKVWRAGCWQPDSALPESLGAIRVDPDASPDQIAEQWFDYCTQVAAWNARCWQIRQEQELRLEQARQLARTPIRDLLPSGPEVVRGLAIEPQ